MLWMYKMSLVYIQLVSCVLGLEVLQQKVWWALIARMANTPLHTLQGISLYADAYPKGPVLPQFESRSISCCWGFRVCLVWDFYMYSLFIQEYS